MGSTRYLPRNVWRVHERVKRDIFPPNSALQRYTRNVNHLVTNFESLRLGLSRSRDMLLFHLAYIIMSNLITANVALSIFFLLLETIQTNYFRSHLSASFWRKQGR